MGGSVEVLGWSRKGEVTPGGHLRDAADRLQGAQEDASGADRIHRFCINQSVATDVGAVVIAVDEIDVDMAGRAEENRVAGSLSVVGMGAGIDGAKVGLGFDDASGEEFPTFAGRRRMRASLGRLGRPPRRISSLPSSSRATVRASRE